MIYLLDLECMVHACVYLVLSISLTWVFVGVTVDFMLAFLVLNNHGMVGSLVFG